MNIADYQSPDVIQAALSERRIAIVGLSSNELRASNFVGYYMRRHNYDVIPGNPREQESLGSTCYSSLTEVPGDVDVVDVFRASDAVPEIAREALEIGAKYLWLQFGVISEEGIRIAEEGGLHLIVDRCLKVEHARHIGRMHWLGFNTQVISAERKPAV